MRLIDSVGFLPPGVAPEVWHPILADFYDSTDDIVPEPTDEAMLGWLKRLTEEEIYTEFTVLTTGSRMLFWSLAPERVRVQALTGKSLVKTMRAPDAETWATWLACGTNKKSDVAKLIKQPELAARVLELLAALAGAAADPTVVYEVPEGYRLLLADDFDEWSSACIDAVRSGTGFAWDTETEQSGDDDTDAPNPYTAVLVGLSLHLDLRPGDGDFGQDQEGATTWYLPTGHRWPEQERPDAATADSSTHGPDEDNAAVATQRVQHSRARLVQFVRDLYRARRQYLEAKYGLTDQVGLDANGGVRKHHAGAEPQGDHRADEVRPQLGPPLMARVPGVVRGQDAEVPVGTPGIPGSPVALAEAVAHEVHRRQTADVLRAGEEDGLRQDGNLPPLQRDGTEREVDRGSRLPAPPRLRHHRPDTWAPWDEGDLRRAARSERDATTTGRGAAVPPAHPSLVATWNMKYDFSVMAAPAQGVPIEEVYTEWLPMTEDGMLLAALANKRDAKLKGNSERELGVKVMDFNKLVQKPKTFADVPPEPAMIYACGDADWTWQLLPIMLEAARDLDVLHLYDEIEHPIVEVFMRMERRGVLMNELRLSRALQDLEERLEFQRNTAIAQLKAAGVELPADFNIDSKDQLAVVLFSQPPRGLGLPVLKRTGVTNRPSVDKKHRNALFAAGHAPPVLRLLHKYIEDTKEFTSYQKPLPQYIQPDGRTRGSYHQLGAATGRTSMTHPAGQTYPEEIKAACMADGNWVVIDFSQIELRTLAAESDEPVMLDAFARGEDIHAATQRDVGLPSRRLAKNFNFGVSFGGGEGTIAETGGIPVAEARAFLQQYKATYVRLFEYVAERLAEVLQSGIIRNWAGRARVVPDNLRDDDQLRRMVMNTPIQGGALDIAKMAMRNCIPLIRVMEQHGIHPVGFNHDEMDFESEWWVPPKDMLRWVGRVALEMYSANPFQDKVRIPAKVSIGRTWGECK